MISLLATCLYFFCTAVSSSACAVCRESRLADPEPKKLYSPLPVLWVTGVQAKDLKTRTASVYECPVYRTKKRTGLNFVTKFQLKVDDEPQRWVLRGAALLCSVD